MNRPTWAWAIGWLRYHARMLAMVLRPSAGSRADREVAEAWESREGKNPMGSSRPGLLWVGPWC